MTGTPTGETVGLGDLTARSARTAELVEQLHAIVNELEVLHPGRKFPLDGHLVGSIGEAAAEALFDLTLVTASTAGHDAVASDGRQVEIKATYGTRGVALRDTSHAQAAALIVLRLSREALVPHEVVYNGPLVTLAAAGAIGALGGNGQSHVSLSRLRLLNENVPRAHRVPERWASG